MLDRRDTFAARQAQWDAFHAWESSRAPVDLTIEQRVAWYIEAFRWARDHGAAPARDDLQTRSGELMERRRRLAHLDRYGRNG